MTTGYINEELDLEDLIDGLYPTGQAGDHAQAAAGVTGQDNQVTVVKKVPFDENAKVYASKAKRGTHEYSVYVDMIKDLVLDKTVEHALWRKLGKYYCENGFIIFYEFKRSSGNILGSQATRMSISNASVDFMVSNLKKSGVVGGVIIVGENLYDVMAKTIEHRREGKPWGTSFREATKELPLRVAGQLVTTATGILITTAVERITLGHSWKILGFEIATGTGIILAVIGSVFTSSESIVTEEEEQEMLSASRKERELIDALQRLNPIDS